ncbi:MAG: hypothetical protein LBD11_00310 [Candidatus Peribacteria bacterium]|jgi:hypothetical protein|nr:hypothetical protein [Candidatus Peribacteria bacterium]
MMKKNLIFVFVGLVVVFCGSLLWRECCEQGSGVSEPDKAVRVLDRLSQKAFSDLAVAVGAEGLYLLPYPYAEDLSEVQLFSGGALAGLTSSTGTYTW